MKNGFMRAVERGLAAYGLSSMAASNPAAAARLMSGFMGDAGDRK